MTKSFRVQSFLTTTSLIVLFVLSVTPAAAQSAARIEGSVTDTSGAALPGVTVTATNQETNVARVAVTNEEGQYAIPSLIPGDYRVQGDLSGFRPGTTPVTLTVGQVARIDLTLGMGVEQVVTVTANAPVIDKTTSQISTVITEDLVEDLPLNGRNFTQLAALVPGVNRGTPGGAASGRSGNAETFRYAEFGGPAISVNGAREQFNNYLIEGLDNNESLVNSIAYMPSPEAIREFSVITTSAPAEFGRAAGAVQNLVIKSGTNDFDGTVYYFIRPESLAAKPEFAVEKPEFENEDFGVTAGGPLFRDRTFYFASYHGLRNTIPQEVGRRVTVPTLRMRDGDFSELLDTSFTGLPDPVIIYDPETGVPFPNNVIPSTMIDPVGRAYLRAFPEPDFPGLMRNYLTHRQRDSTYDDFDLKFDHTFGPSDQLFVGGSQWDDSFSDPGFIPGFQAGFGSGTSENTGFSLRTGETHVFSGNLVNEARVGYTDFHFAFLPVGFGTDQNAELGIGGIGGVTTPNGISLIGGGDGRFLEYLGDFGQYKIDQQTIQLSDSVTWLRGNHTFKFGGSAMRRELGQQRAQFGKGFYFFRDGFGFEPGYTGYEVSDMLIGRTNFTVTAVPGFVPRNAIHWENALFFQDDWHVLPNLTLNLGLRWDVFTPYYEEDDQMANFDPATGTLVLPDQGGVSRSTVDTDTDNFGPRIGFNYLIDDKTTLRAGYGIYYGLDRGGIDNQLTENPPAVVTQFRFGDTPGARVRLSEPIPLPTPINPNNLQLPDGTVIVYIPSDSESSEIQQWSVSAQRELFRNTSALLAFVGSRGENLAAQLSTGAGGFGSLQQRLRTIRYIGESEYDSIQASVRRSQSNGLSFLASYTYAEARNNTPGFFPGDPTGGNPVPTDPNCGVVNQPCNLDLDEGRADNDSRNRFTFAGTWALPFARDNALLGGWNLNAVYTLQSGSPFTIYTSGGLRADQIGDAEGPKTIDEWFETSNFRAATGSQGTAERNSVVGPGYRTLDLSLFKTFGLGPAGDLEFRVEGFNVLDTPQYGQPNQFVGDSNFGKIASTRTNSERQVQLAVRYLF